MKFFSCNNKAPLMSIVALLLLNSSSVTALNNAKSLTVSTCNSCAVGSNYFCQPEGAAYDGVLCCTDSLKKDKDGNDALVQPTEDELSQCDRDTSQNNCSARFSTNPGSFYTSCPQATETNCG